ncbi:MAG: LamG domain-containing protein [Lentisphaeraceae bacterium]|nr:LamG domain-containing protein [Lentisphaeraceae bacterium]
MSDADRLDLLLDLSLNGEATDEQLSELQSLVSSSDEMMELYFESIDQQLTLQQQFEHSTQVPLQIEAQKKKIPFLWLVMPIVIFVLAVFTLFKGGKSIPQKVQFTVTQESHSVSIFRANKDIKAEKNTILQNLDLVDVDSKGELWLKTNSGDDLYLSRGSQMRMDKKSTEAFQLLKGSVSGDLSHSKGVLSFITRDLEIIADKARFSAAIKNNITKVCVMEGSVKLTRLKDGKTISLGAKQTVLSDTFSINQIAPEDSHIFPKLEKGVNYYYFELKDNSYDETRIIDQGIVNNLSIQRGQYEGYIRGRPDSHSDVAQGPFHMILKSLYKSEKTGKVTFRVTGRKGTVFSIKGKSIEIDKDFTQKLLNVELEKGFYPLTVHSPGVLEDDIEQYELHVETSFGDSEFKPVTEESLYHRNPHPLPDQFTEQNIDRTLSARLPLKGNFKDIINNQEAAPIGSPHFIKDPKFGIVCELDGKKDYLVHLPVDQLGMAQNYTASAWIKIHPGAYYDQPLFANSAGDYNATLVLLVRRMHPYLAHLHNDTVAGEKLEYGKWAHVVFRYHNGEQAIFLDGKLAVNSYNHSSLFSNKPLLIGHWNGKRLIKGLLRDIRIYNTALSASDIELLYKETNSRKD